MRHHYRAQREPTGSGVVLSTSMLSNTSRSNIGSAFATWPLTIAPDGNFTASISRGVTVGAVTGSPTRAWLASMVLSSSALNLGPLEDTSATRAICPHETGPRARRLVTAT